MSKLKDSMNKLGCWVAVGAKLPESKEACHADGFDVESWAKDSLVDFAIGGSRTVTHQTASSKERRTDPDHQAKDQNKRRTHNKEG